MCQLFINADPSLWESVTRSLRIDGVVTSIRLEQYFWLILEEIAHRDAMNVNQLITKLYLESLDADHDISNFTSFLRVCCARFLSLIADGQLTRQTTGSLTELNAAKLLENERTEESRRSLSRTPTNKNSH
ncbi:hypothetical protein PALB_13480 [Pseudoalteromonas luteoviolacea B = ATCC 29581]|nr:hypothetical protein PALB_13480 [Pseudoalteromonas luteoviolacea B = ATCC 29581]